MREHISAQYDSELDTIRTHLVEMASAVEAQFEGACRALLEGDAEAAETAIAADARVNELEVIIDDLCSHIIVRRQPTASDLRLILATIKTITDLERIGDESRRIAKMARSMAERAPIPETFPEIEAMTTAVTGMLRDGLHAFFRVDVQAAADVIARDKAVDRDYKAFAARVVPAMEATPQALAGLLDLLWGARALERIGDHAKNVAEYVIYLGHGEDVRHQPLETKQRMARGDAPS